MSTSKVPLIKSTKATRPRNAFDISQRHLFTAPAGALLPVLSLDLLPHDHVEINASDFMRTLPMNSAAFMSMRGVYEFYFVPYKQLWSGFDQFITGMSDYKSSFMYAFKGKTPPSCVSFDVQKLVDWCKTNTAKDIHGFDKNKGVYRILDLLGYGKYASSAGVPYTSPTSGPMGNCTPFRGLAYQKIYNDFYRNTTYEEYQLESFNVDMFYGSGKVKETIPNEPWDYDWFTLRYRNAQKDLLTNVRPTPLFSLDDFNPKFFLGGSDIVMEKGRQITGGTHEYRDSVVIVGNNLKENGVDSKRTMISVADIRNAFALEKLASVTMRAGKTYKEQMEAHFGISVEEGRDGRCTYIGGFDSNIQVGDVTQSSGTTVTGTKDTSFGGYLGRTTGKATGSGSGHIRFDAKEHGILMCIYSLVPDVQYDSKRVDPFVQKIERGDFFVPEFENLGMQPVFAKNISYKYNNNVANSRIKNVGAFGWQPRYSEYKTALDINHGQFVHNEPLSYCTVARARGESMSNFNISTFKINPKWLDDVFAVNYNGTELTDQVFGGCYFNIVKVSDMSIDGMPKV